MAWKALLKPRHVITALALILTVILALNDTIEGDIAATIIVGVLLSYGAYQMPSPRQKEK